jgi:hypothetical protein
VARVIDENPANLVDYGLGAPRIEIQFKAEGDKDFKTLQIGQKTPAGANLFAKVGSGKRVFTIPSFQESTFNRSTFDLRDKTAIKFDRDKVDQVEISADNKTLELANQATTGRSSSRFGRCLIRTATEGPAGSRRR